MKKTVLFVSHLKANCGVYEFGVDIFEALSNSSRYTFIWIEINSINELEAAIKKYKPFATLYNYMPFTMPWIRKKLFFRFFKNKIAHLNTINIAITHFTDQALLDRATNYRMKYLVDWRKTLFSALFDYYVAPDPTLLLKNPIVFKTGKIIRNYKNTFPVSQTPVIGSFGFATPGKGFDKIIIRVQQEFDNALIRLNIPFAKYGDPDGKNSNLVADNCKKLLYKDDIKLEITHNYWDKQQMLDFLAKNTINVFLYDAKKRSDISGAVDNALAARRPIAVSDNSMFRHILSIEPSVCIENNTLKQIIANGIAPLSKFYSEWNAEIILWEYERILAAIENKQTSKGKVKMGIKRTILSWVLRFFSLPDKSFTWLRNTKTITEDSLTPQIGIKYIPITLGNNDFFNRILDDSAREVYKPAEDLLYQLVPKTMAKKIPRATVQQAFIFDTVCRFLKTGNNTKILCVGSYEDTASMGLQKIGIAVEEIDPIINYSLQEYYTKPNVKKESYDIIFSTSVIEHDPEDESFIKCIEGLLAPGGIAIITCDYKDHWKPGDPKLEVNARFYTKKDLSERLLDLIPACELVDDPHWDCPNPDFNLMGKYQYTFATFVFKKKQT